ncbi:MAG: tripartite tricarboxylate transporter permease [Angelakisella sp.]|nr:tripartite tricarboxylate transporter permease [Angelakisella sp.]
MQLIEGFITIFSPATLALIIGGVSVGIIFGAIPGLSAFTCLAIMLPLTFTMEPVNGICFLMAIYVGGCSGGLISAVLLGIPGTPSSIATCFDGYPMAKRGEARRALGTGVVFSFVGGIFSALVLTYLGPIIAQFALKFSPYEYFGVILLALTTVSALSAGNLSKGLLSCLLGVSLAFVGIDKLSAYTRYTMGIKELAAGFNLVPLLIGVFAVSQILEAAAERKFPKIEEKREIVKAEKVKGFGLSWKEFGAQMVNAIPSSIIGLAIGILPGIGGNVSNLMAYAFVKKRSKTPEKFGTGFLDGIVASETANNATIGGALIVLLTLGIPGDNATAMILAGFQLHGITPGPLLFKTSADMVYALFAAFMLANVVMLVVEYFGLPLFTKLLSVPSSYLLPVVIAFCVVGSFSANNRTFDIMVMMLFGFIGFIMKRFGYPLAPMVVGFILAPMLEENLRRSLMRTNGSFMPILQSPIALMFLLLTVVMVAFTVRGEIRDAKKGKAAQGEVD